MKLKLYLVRNKITTKDFAKKIGKEPTYISRIISGARYPSRSLAKIIQEATNGEITAAELLTE